jgi:hypothetical protein
MNLRPYQQQIVKAVVESVLHDRGITFSVEMARQGGKNELSAHLEVLLLTLFMVKGGSIVKCSPTFKPQTIISIERLKERLDEFNYGGIYQTEAGYMIRLLAAKAVFLSADVASSVMGHTADVLLEVDEAQDVDKAKYSKEFRPMASAFNATSLLYGTTWDDTTLLEETKQVNLEMQSHDHIQRHFKFDWQEVAKFNPAYLRFVESERARLGENHPLFRTQYSLLPISGAGFLLTRQQRVLCEGTHSRLSAPSPSQVYVAGIDLAGAIEQDKETLLSSSVSRRDSTVITIAKVTSNFTFRNEPEISVVEHFEWQNIPHSQLYPQMVGIIKKWDLKRVVVDATGIGEPVASFLKAEFGRRIIPFVFTARSKSELGFDLLAAINSTRLKFYKPDNSDEYRNLMLALEHARVQYRPNQTMNFFVEPSEGHDDYLSSLALVVHAAKDYRPRVATGA